MALTELIEQELLATLDGGTDPQEIMRRYSGSKGPLYAALAKATAEATRRFTVERQRLQETQGRRKRAEELSVEAGRLAKEGERQQKAAQKELERLGAAIQVRQGLLDRANGLREVGFDADSLAALGRTFAQVAKATGDAPAKAVARFLKMAGDFESVVAFEGKLREAEERAKKAETEAQKREYSAKVRKVAVDWAEWLVRQRIAPETVGAWKSAAERLGLTPQTLAGGLKAALEKFGGMEAVIRAKVHERDELGREIAKSRAAIEKLKVDRERITAALQAVAEEGTGRVAEAEEQAVAAIESVRHEALATLEKARESYVDLTRKAAALEPTVRFAQALADPHEMFWMDVTPDQWAALLRHLDHYLTLGGNREAPPPEQVGSELNNRLRYPYSHGALRLRDLVDWLIIGLLKPEPSAIPVKRLGLGGQV